MSEHIILTAEEAEKVRGVTRPGHALDKARAVDLHEPTKRRIVRRDELKEDLAEDIKGGR